MKVKYLQKVTAPSHLAGEAGEVKEMESHLARDLIEKGYLEEIKKGAKSADKRTDIAGE